MEAMDRPAFARCLMELSVAFDRTVSDPKADLMWERMRDVPVEVVEQATEKIIREQKRFPSIAVWRETCDDVAHSRVAQVEHGRLALPPVEGQPYYCDACHDSGWEPVIVPTSAIYGDDYRAVVPTTRRVRRCACWASNPRRPPYQAVFFTGARDAKGR